ncbi:MAG: hypothetical protein ACJ76F_04890 [Bacteroidia bacterium]
MKGKFELIFECSQDWNKMKSVTEGRHCETCCKTVIDFTHLSPHEIKAHAHKKNLCARFYEGQLDPFLVKPIESGRPFKLFLFLSTFSLGLCAKNPMKLHEKPGIEHSSAQKSMGSEISIYSAGPDQSEYSGPGNKKPFMKTKKKVFYWSKRFPFVVCVQVVCIRQGTVRFLED